MNINVNMPLSSLLDRLLKGEDRDVHEEELYTYFENRAHGDKKVLHQALTETETKIKSWKQSYFISIYDAMAKAYKHGEIRCTPEELDNLFYEEEYKTKEGKTGITADYLYNSISRHGFTNEHQQDAIETAWTNNDIEFLQTVWEDLALAQIRSVQAIIISMLTTASAKVENDAQSTNRPQKQIETYPEVFGMDICRELTGYSKHTLYKLTSKNNIPYFRPGHNGRMIKFKRDEIVEWMTARREETTDEYINRMDEAMATRNNQYL